MRTNKSIYPAKKSIYFTISIQSGYVLPLAAIWNSENIDFARHKNGLYFKTQVQVNKAIDRIKKVLNG